MQALARTAPRTGLDLPDEIVVEAPVDGATDQTELADQPPGFAVSDALKGVPGVTLRGMGGPGDVVWVSIRGADPRQVLVTFDGIPLNADGAGAVDLSEFPIALLQSAVVHPTLLNARESDVGIGGSLALQTTRASGARARLWGGSFYTGGASGIWSGAVGKDHLLVGADITTTQGNFRAFQDRGTVYNRADDRLVRRENNDATRLSGLARYAHPWGQGELAVLYTINSSLEGVPGNLALPTSTVRYSYLRNMLAVQVERDGRIRSRGRAWGSSRVEWFDDPLGEIGVGRQDLRTHLWGAGLHGDLETFGPKVGVQFGSQARVEGTTLRDQLTESTDAAGRAVWRLASDLVVRRQQVLFKLGAGGLLTGSWGEGQAPAYVYAVPRTSLQIWAIDALQFRVAAGGGTRIPDLQELYGDRGATVGNPDLRPEKAWFGEAGVAGRTQGAVRFRAGATGFARWTFDRITWVQNAQRVGVPVNLGQALVAGAELGLNLEHRVVRSDVAATYSWSRNMTQSDPSQGNPLPQVPLWNVVGSVATTPGPAEIGTRVTWRAGMTYDSQAQIWSAPQLWWDAWAAWRFDLKKGSIHLGFSCKNMLNTIAEVVPQNPLAPEDGQRVVRAVTDYVGYPLPGRTMALELQWSTF